jgi:hypothetical protein
MSRLYETLEAFFTEVGLPAQPLEVGYSGFQIANYPGDNGRWRMIALALESDLQLVFYSMLPFKVQMDRRAAIAEFIDRVNYGLVMGNYELDWNDGDIRFKTSMGVAGIDPPTQLLTQVVMFNLITFDHYLPALQAVIAGDLSPSEAVLTAESAETASLTST